MKLRLDVRVFKVAAAVLAIILVLLGGLLLLNTWESAGGNTPGDSPLPTNSQSVEEERDLVYFNGSWYAKREGLETVLFLGLDKFEDTAHSSYVNNQQSDFLMLLVLDRKAEHCTVIHLNRDTMTQIQALGVDGRPTNTFTGQLALAHTYGTGGKDSCRNTVKAVSELLYGMEIDHYISMTMDGVALLNDLVGGVTLEVMDDFSKADPTLVQGETVTLMGEHALIYVRARGEMEDSSNLRRMERQRQYLSALQKQAAACMEQDTQFALKSLLEVNEYLVSDCTVEKLSDLADFMNQYGMDEFLTLKGEAVEGKEFMEYYVDEEALQQLVMDVFYEPAEEA